MDVSSSRRSNSSDTVLIILNLSFGWKKTTNSRWSSEISESDRAFCRARWLHHPSEKRDALVVQMSRWKYHQKMSQTTNQSYTYTSYLMHLLKEKCTGPISPTAETPIVFPPHPLLRHHVHAFHVEVKTFPRRRQIFGHSCGDCHETGSKYPVCLAY